jgi:hypothetical protein
MGHGAVIRMGDAQPKDGIAMHHDAGQSRVYAWTFTHKELQYREVYCAYFGTADCSFSEEKGPAAATSMASWSTVSAKAQKSSRFAQHTSSSPQSVDQRSCLDQS